MRTLHEGIAEYRKQMTRRGFAETSQNRYRRELERFAAHAGDVMLDEVTPDVVQGFLDTFDNHAPSTINLEFTILGSFFKHLVRVEWMSSNPMARLEPPKVPALRDRVRTRVSQDQVDAMLRACRTWPEILCLYSFAFLGLRRSALARARWGDVDGKARTLTVLEKGGKRRTKPVPDALWRVWTRYAIEQGPVAPDDWIVPNRRDTGRRDERSSRICWYIVRDVAKRAGVKSHCHALRSAFAVRFLRENPAHLDACRQLLGHASVQTTTGYLDDLEPEALMRLVGDISYGGVAA